MIETIKQLHENEKKVIGELEDRISLLEIASRPTPLSKSKVIISPDKTGMFFWDQVSPIPYEYQEGDQYDFPPNEGYSKNILEYLLTYTVGYKIQHIDSNNLYVDYSLAYMFRNIPTLQNISGLKAWDVCDVKSFSCLFKSCSSLTDISPLASWDVSNVNNVSDLFSNCSSLEDISALTNWNVSNVTNLAFLFNNCSSLENISALTNWNVSNVITLNYLFEDCSTLTDISPLARWDVSNVGSAAYVFENCSKILSVKPLANWNVSRIYAAEHMFAPDSGSYSLMATDYDSLEPWGEKLTALSEANKKRSYFGIPENKTLPSWMRNE